MPNNKSALRAELRDRRRALPTAVRDDAASKIVDIFSTIPPFGVDAVIAAYYPLKDECDPRLLINALRARGHSIVLPVTAPKAQPLLFRLWDGQAPLVKSPFGVMEPDSGDFIAPDVLLVPMLGFDAACHRLGYGAGHYDCTIAQLRNQGKRIFTAGLAFECQYIDSLLPVEAHDVALDCVVTQDRLYWPRPVVGAGDRKD